MKTIDFILLTFKYWLQGDSLTEAKTYARRIVFGFKR